MSEEFFDIENHKYKPGQIMVQYMAMADLMEGPEKQQIIKLLNEKEAAIATMKIMSKLLHASYLDSIQVPLRMAQDLKNGESAKQVEKKPYRYKIEKFYFTSPEHVPDDPHWRVVEMAQISGKISP